MNSPEPSSEYFWALIFNGVLTRNFYLGRGGGQVVSALAFNSDNLSLNPAEDYCFFRKLLLVNIKDTTKRPGSAHFKKPKK